MGIGFIAFYAPVQKAKMEKMVAGGISGGFDRFFKSLFIVPVC